MSSVEFSPDQTMPAIMQLHPELEHMLHCDPLKPNSGHLYVRQPHTIQIIQLVEGPPPPQRRLASVIHSSDPRSSSASSGPSTSDSEEDCSSYCSSVITPDESSDPIPWTDDTFHTRMKRVHAWRDGFVNATSEPRTPSLKRKSNSHPTDDDAASHTSKRSRSRDGHSISRLTGHPCPACDTPFPSLASLRKHGRASDTPEACRVAVEYDFEYPPPSTAAFTLSSSSLTHTHT
ncbi:hypothetical protein JVU11DRAFT_9956 [Chiua virens]|nr:hypothetical protein JVU11DRAFT_9956 [Chiua virens]